MKYLLDTHTYIWLAADPGSLSQTVQKIVLSPENERLLSAASGWEIALLGKLKRIKLPEDPALYIPQTILSLYLAPIGVDFETAISGATLPQIHRDPFERLLVATAKKENIPILSKNQILPQYDVSVIW